MYIEMNRSFQAQYRANRFHKPTQTIGVKIMKNLRRNKNVRPAVQKIVATKKVAVEKFLDLVARCNNTSELLKLVVNNGQLIFSCVAVRSHAEFRECLVAARTRLWALRSQNKAVDNTVQARINRAILLNAADKAVRKSVATLVAQAQEGVLVTPAMILEVEAKLGFQLSEGALKAIFFAYVNKGVAMFDLAIQFAESISSDFVMSVFKTIRFMERTAVRAMMVAKGLLSTGKVAVSKALAVAFAVAKTA